VANSVALTQTTVTSNTFNTVNTANANSVAILEIRADRLDVANGFTAIQVNMAQAANQTANVTYIMGNVPRFAGGMKMDAGPLAFQSQRAPSPLSREEEAALAFAAGGVTGSVLGDLPYSAGGNIMTHLVGRTVASGDAMHTVTLFVLAASNRRRLLPLGIVVAAIISVSLTVVEVPIDPGVQRLLFGFGASLAGIAVFLGFDLLTTAVAMFGGSLLLALPLVSVAQGDALRQLIITSALPLVAITLFGIAARLTGREVVYTYENLAPHVRRIIERERVKAEIDAANRIQAALLPLDTPSLAGASVASHYRAATEIGGDYFDFLLQPTGEIGIAFGDVSGHGLTSGIVMAMAKSALLVQVDNDPSPAVVLRVLNDIVMKTAPKRMLMTFFFGLLDPSAQQLRFSSAGHLDPYVFRAASARLEPLSSWGFPLGVRRREPFREHEVEFAAGDRLILYSDGLIEALDDDGEPFGFERFERVLLEHGHGSAEEIKKALLSSIRKFTHNRPPEDDQTLVVVSFDEAVAEVLRPVVTSYSDHVN